MPHRSRWRPSMVTAGAGVLLAAGLLAGAGHAIWREKFELTAEAAARQALLARVLEDHASRSLDATQLALAGLADVAERGAPPEVLQALLGQTQASLGFLRGVALLDDSGRVLAAADPADRGAQIAPQRLGPWPAAGQVEVGRFVAARSLAGLAPGPAAAVPPGVGFIPLSRGIRLPDGRAALLTALLNPDALATFQELTLDDERAAAALVDLDGQLLAVTASAERLAGERPAALQRPDGPLASVRAGSEHGRWDGPGLRDEAQLGTFRALRDRSLVVTLELPRQALNAQWLATARDLGLPALAAAAALLALSAVGAAALRGRERSMLQLDEAQRQVAARERELSAIFGSVRDLLFRTDAAGHVTLINEGYARLSGQPVAEVLGRPLQEVFGGSPAVAALFAPGEAGEAGEDARPHELRAEWQDADGRLRSFEIHLVPLRREAGRLEWVGSAADVSGLVSAQAELRAQLGLAHSLLSSSPLPMSVLDGEGRYLDVNRAWEQFTGRRRSEVLGRNSADYLRPDEAALHQARNAELLARGGEMNYEAVWHGSDGRRRDLYISKATFPDAQGRPMGIVVCFMDISDFREAERATRAARDAALQASRAKSDFIANVSHELRTPLQSILGFAEIGALRARAEPRLAELFGEVQRAGQRMLNLVNDLLDLSKIERGAEPFEPERLDLRPLVAELGRELQPLLDARQLGLALDLGDADLVVLADPQRLQQLLRNLLANAIRFSPPGGRIDVKAWHDEAADEVRVDVADRGPGIPPDELESIFEAFVQSSATRNADGGTGLGLAICRRIAEAHDGRVWAANRAEGGARVSLALPAARFGDTSAAAL